MRLHEVQLLCEAIASVEQWIDREAGRGRQLPGWMTARASDSQSPLKIWFDTVIKNLNTLEKATTVEVEKKVKEFFKSAFVTSYEKWLEREELFGSPVPEGEVGRIRDWFQARLRGKLSELRKYGAQKAIQATNEYHDRVFAQQEKGSQVQVGQSEAPVVYESKRWVVRMPKTHQATCFFGKGTRWCITMQSDHHYQRYLGKGEKFFIIEDKVTPQIKTHSYAGDKEVSSRVKYAFIPEQGEYRDNADALLTPEQIHDILYSDPGLKDFMIANLPKLDDRFLKALEPQDKQTLFEKMEPNAVLKWSSDKSDSDLFNYALKRGANPIDAGLYRKMFMFKKEEEADFIEKAKPESLLNYTSFLTGEDQNGLSFAPIEVLRKTIEKGADIIKGLSSGSFGMNMWRLYHKLTPEEKEKITAKTPPNSLMVFAASGDDIDTFLSAIKRGANPFSEDENGKPYTDNKNVSGTVDDLFSGRLKYPGMTNAKKFFIDLMRKGSPQSVLVYAVHVVHPSSAKIASYAIKKGAQLDSDITSELIRGQDNLANYPVLKMAAASGKITDWNEFFNQLITTPSKNKNQAAELYQMIMPHIKPNQEWLEAAIQNDDIVAVDALLNAGARHKNKMADLAALAGEHRASEEMINYLVERAGPPARYDLTRAGEVGAFKKGKGYYVEFEEYKEWAPLFSDSDARDFVEKLFSDDAYEMFDSSYVQPYTYSDIQYILSKDNQEKISRIVKGKTEENEDYDVDEDEELNDAFSYAHSDAQRCADEGEAHDSVMSEIFDYLGLDYKAYRQMAHSQNKRKRLPVQQVQAGKYKGKDGNEYDKWKFVAVINQNSYNRMYADSIARDYLDAEPPIEWKHPYNGWSGSVTKADDCGFNDLLADRLHDLDPG